MAKALRSGKQRVGEGPTWLDAGFGARLAASRPELVARVSPAQHRVLELLLTGMTEPEIAAKIDRSRHTVHDHTKAIYASLGVRSRVELVLLFAHPKLV